MFTKKRIIIIIIIIVILVIIGVSLKSSEVDYVTAKIDQGIIKQTVDATGSIESSQAIELNFKTVGRLQTLNVTTGDKVEAGQILATLESGALQSRVVDARSNLLEAQANYDKLISGATPEDIHISQINVEQKKQALLTAKNNLTNLKAKAKTDLHNLKNTAIIVLNNEIINANASLETIDSTLNDDDAEKTLGALNSNSVDIAKTSQTVAINSVNNTKLNLSTIFEYSPDQQILDEFDDELNTLDKVRDCLNNVFNVLENTITSSDLSQSELDSLISSIQTKQTLISSSFNNLQTAKTNWTNKEKYYQEQISQAENNLTAAENSLRLAQAQLSLKEADPQSYEITAAQARITKAQANLSLALANLNDTIIRAPVKGTIIEVNQDLGEQTSFAQPVISMIGESPLEIEVNIPESDIAKINIGQKVEITLDSFGDDVIFPGTVTFVDPAETVIQDVVYYQVKVQFTNQANGIKPGMTANVVIIIQTKNDVLRLPLRALKQKDGKKYVEILVNKKIKQREIKTGLRGDDYIEILDGLIKNDKVITYIKNKK